MVDKPAEKIDECPLNWGRWVLLAYNWDHENCSELSIVSWVSAFQGCPLREHTIRQPLLNYCAWIMYALRTSCYPGWHAGVWLARILDRLFLTRSHTPPTLTRSHTSPTLTQSYFTRSHSHFTHSHSVILHTLSLILQTLSLSHTSPTLTHSHTSFTLTRSATAV